MSVAALQVGVILLDSYQWLDAAGPLDSMTMLTPSYLKTVDTSPALLEKAVPMNFHYISHSMDPVTAAAGPQQLPTCTYTTCPPLNILFIPGSTLFANFSSELVRFVQQRVQEVDVVLTVCTGSILLACAGVLDEKRASTNKNVHKYAVSTFPQVQWMVKGRWTVDDKFWTSGGVTAGMDMMAAFLMSRYDHALVKWIHRLAEFEPKQRDDDPFVWIIDNNSSQ